jgi:hypothetical protein
MLIHQIKVYINVIVVIKNLIYFKIIYIIYMEKLFIKYCPIFYFHKKEPYMPTNFDDILKISGHTPESIKNNDVKIINIPKEKRTDVSVATQILCKTSGNFTVKNITYCDLIYIIIFTWNGTIEDHVFDKEEVIVRIKINNINDELVRVYGSSHGNGMWFNKNQLEFNGDRFIMYSANESHAMYNKSRVYKNIFGFGNDVTRKDIKWDPSEFVIFGLDGTVKIIKKDNKLINGYSNITGDFNYFKVNKNIGNNQQWPGSIEYDTLNLDGYYKYQGGIDYLFTGPKARVSETVRIILRVLVVLTWIGFFGYIIFGDILNYKNHIYSKKKLALFITLHTLLVFCLFITGAILGLDIFILSPIGSP